MDVIYDDSTDVEEFSDGQDLVEITESLKVQDYVLVAFRTKKSIKYYVGQITGDNNEDDYKVNFLRKQTEGMKFCFPQIMDKSIVRAEDIVMKLPTPTTSGTTARTTQVFNSPSTGGFLFFLFKINFIF